MFNLSKRYKSLSPEDKKICWGLGLILLLIIMYFVDVLPITFAKYLGALIWFSALATIIALIIFRIKKLKPLPTTTSKEIVGGSTKVELSSKKVVIPPEDFFLQKLNEQNLPDEDPGAKLSALKKLKDNFKQDHGISVIGMFTPPPLGFTVQGKGEPQLMFAGTVGKDHQTYYQFSDGWIKASP